jgi:cysteinyl-tRNA synthetase
LENACRSLDERIARLGTGLSVSTPAGRKLVEAAREAKVRFLEAMDDDFNSAGAIGHLFDLIKTYNVLLDEDEASVGQSREGLEAVWSALTEFDRILGLFKNGLPRAQEDIPSEIQAMVAERNKAKQEKNFQLADDLRKRLLGAGFVLEDTPAGVRVRRR